MGVIDILKEESLSVAQHDLVRTAYLCGQQLQVLIDDM